MVENRWTLQLNCGHSILAIPIRLAQAKCPVQLVHLMRQQMVRGIVDPDFESLRHQKFENVINDIFSCHKFEKTKTCQPKHAKTVTAKAHIFQGRRDRLVLIAVHFHQPIVIDELIQPLNQFVVGIPMGIIDLNSIGDKNWVKSKKVLSTKHMTSNRKHEKSIT